MIKYIVKGKIDMNTIYILNPAAGQGKAMEYKNAENAYVTRCVGDATDFVKSKAAENDTHFKVCGGDGTVNEVVNGLIASGGDSSFSIIPVGTGNDMLRTFNETGLDECMLDVLTVDDRYAVNAVNTGFDLDVVIKASEYKKKPLISGHLAYVLGVISVFCKKFGKHIMAEFTDKDGNTETFSGDAMLAVCANGRFYGGGFKCAPIAEISDGLIDFMVIKKVSRLRFLSLVLGYKAGKHVDKKTGRPTRKFEKYIIYKKCRSVKLSGLSRICADGEIWDASSVTVDIIHGAVKLKKEIK